MKYVVKAAFNTTLRRFKEGAVIGPFDDGLEPHTIASLVDAKLIAPEGAKPPSPKKDD